MKAVRESALDLPLLRKGKVREMYDLDEHILLVASDRISAFDCILPQPIPHKGAVLTQISKFWFDRTESIVQSHSVSADPDVIIEHRPELPREGDARYLAGRQGRGPDRGLREPLGPGHEREIRKHQGDDIHVDQRDLLKEIGRASCRERV